MRHSKRLAIILAAIVCLAAAVAFAMTGSYASEAYGQSGETVEYGGKVVLPGWCLEHGYIALQDTPDPLVCLLCDDTTVR